MAGPDYIRFDTLSLHAGQQPDSDVGARATPIYQTTSYVFKNSDHAAALFNAERAGHALDAGCDILLVCNNPAGADEVLDALQGYSNPTSQIRMVRLHGEPPKQGLFETQRWLNACEDLRAFNHRLGLASSGDLFE